MKWRSTIWLALASTAGVAACFDGEAAPPDRRPVVAPPLDDVGESARGFSGTVEFPDGRLHSVVVDGLPIRPARTGPPATVKVRFRTIGLAGARGRLGLLPAHAAARQEVAFGSPGQPDDPRARWTDIVIEGEGMQRYELPGPGADWHAGQGVVVLELRQGRTRLRAIGGPRSEMVEGGRLAGGRATLAVIPIEAAPTEVVAPRVSAGAIELDGRLDEPVWQRPGARLVRSRDGEPADGIDTKLGGPTRVWFAWDETHLYVAGDLPDRDLYAPHARRDDPLYRDEAFEVFLAGDNTGRRYLEHQVSARGVQFDARFPEYRKGDEGWDGGWQRAVALDGSLEGRGDDRGWTVELAFPWSELCADTEIACPPQPEQSLRTNVFRLDKPDRERQVGLALSPTLRPDFHAWDNAATLTLVAD